MTWGMLFDSTKCIGCGACEAACKEQNNLPRRIDKRTTAYTWTKVEKRGNAHVRRMCMHCVTPTCVSVCPVAAMKKSKNGPVTYDAKQCIGCRYCIMACPFDVPKYEWDTALPIVGKCVMCAPRVAKGLPTACSTVCPTGATKFGDRDALITEARARVAAEPDRYVQQVYGVEEAGGTSVLMIAGMGFGELGLPTDLPKEPLPMLTWRVLSHLPDLVSVAAVGLFGIHWITQRREEVRTAEGGHGGRGGRGGHGDPGDGPVEPPNPPRGRRTGS